MKSPSVSLMCLSLVFHGAAVICARGQEAPPAADLNSLTFAPVVKKIAPATVTVAQVRMLRGSKLETFRALDPSEQRIYLRTGELMKIGDGFGELLSHGSGFVIDAKGHIVTNHHVVEMEEGQPAALVVAVAEGEWMPAKLTGSDPSTDIAVLQAEIPSPVVVTWGDIAKLAPGDIVLAVGSPRRLSLRQTVTMGIVSAIGRADGDLIYEDFIQTDASINGGNSGGPLVSVRGEVVGVNQSILTGMVETSDGNIATGGAGDEPLLTTGNLGIGYAIPASLARKVAEEIIAHGRVRRGFAGVKVEEGTAGLGKGKASITVSGLRVTAVLPGSPAEKSGVQKTDLLLAFAGSPLGSVHRFHLAVSLAEPAVPVKIDLVRNGARHELTIIPTDLASTPWARIGFAPGIPDFPELDGVELRLERRPGGDESIVISRVARDCAAAKAGLKAPATVLNVAGIEVIDLESFLRLAATSSSSGYLLVTVKSRTGEKDFSIPLKKSSAAPQPK